MSLCGKTVSSDPESSGFAAVATTIPPACCEALTQSGAGAGTTSQTLSYRVSKQEWRLLKGTSPFAVSYKGIAIFCDFFESAFVQKQPDQSKISAARRSQIHACLRMSYGPFCKNP